MFEKFSRRQFCKARGFSALGMATPARPEDSATQAAGRRRAPQPVSPTASYGGRRHRPIRSKARSMKTAAGRSIWDTFTHTPGKIGDRHQCRPRQRSLSSLQARRAPDQGARRQGLSVFDRMAAGVSGRHRRAEPQGPRLLQSPARRATGEWHRAVRDALSLGPAAGAAGPCRRMAVHRNLESVRGLCRLCGRTLERSRQEHSSRSTKPDGS